MFLDSVAMSSQYFVTCFILTRRWMNVGSVKYMYVGTYMCTYVCMYVCTYYVRVCVFFLYVCMYVLCVCVCMYCIAMQCMYFLFIYLLHAPLLGVILHALQ